MTGGRLVVVIVVAAVTGVALEVAGLAVGDRILCQASAVIIVLTLMDLRADRRRRRQQAASIAVGLREYEAKSADGLALTERILGSGRDYVLVHGSPPGGHKDFFELTPDVLDRLRIHVPDAMPLEAIEVLLARDELSHIPERKKP